MTDFISFARAHGLEIDPLRFGPSERIQRCGTVGKPRSGNGAYFWDGKRGWVFDWSGDARTIWFNDPSSTPWTPEEKRLWAQRRLSQAMDQARRYGQAADKAEKDIERSEIKEHPYLEVKGFPQEKGLVLDDRLLIPMRDVGNGQILGYQSIRWNEDERKYEKKFLPGMKAKGAVFWMGRGDDVWLVEGYATGLSIRAALRACGMPGAVLVCFSAGNLVHVASQVPGRKRVFADNDESGTGQEAAKETGLPWVMADEVGWDANDLHQKRGLFAVTKKLMGA